MKLYDKTRILWILERVFWYLFSPQCDKNFEVGNFTGFTCTAANSVRNKRSETGSLSYLQKHTEMVLAHLFRFQTISLNHSDLRNSDPKVSENCVSELLFLSLVSLGWCHKGGGFWPQSSSVVPTSEWPQNLTVQFDIPPLLWKGVGRTDKAVLSISMVLARAELAKLSLSHCFPKCSVLSLPFSGIFPFIPYLRWAVWNYFVLRMSVSC